MSQTTNAGPSEPTDLSFEAGYERLQEIAGRLNEDEVPVSEMCDLFAEGKGLEIALTDFLDSERGRVEAIESGEGIRTFRITRTPAQSDERRLAESDIPIETGDFVPASTRAAKPDPFRSTAAAAAADDDIPF